MGLLFGVVAQSVRASVCHTEGRGFEPRQSRMMLKYNIEHAMSLAQELVVAIRNIRHEQKIKKDVTLQVYVEPLNLKSFTAYYVFAQDGWFKHIGNMDVHIKLPEDLVDKLLDEYSTR